jgi:hypothetical protein
LDSTNDSIGKTLNALYGFALVGFNIALASQTITVGQSFVKFTTFGTGAAGIATFGFKTAANQVGWLKLDFGGPLGPVTFLAAARNDEPGGSIHSGTGAAAVPEPTSLALAGLAALALGARARRKCEEVVASLRVGGPRFSCQQLPVGARSLLVTTLC